MNAQLDVAQLAELLGVSARSVWRFRDEGRLPQALKVGHAVRWCPETLEAWVAAGGPTAQACHRRSRKVQHGAHEYMGDCVNSGPGIRGACMPESGQTGPVGKTMSAALNPRAEGALLASVLLDPRCLRTVQAVLPAIPAAELFTDRQYAAVWEAIGTCDAEGRDIDVVQVHGAIQGVAVTFVELAGLLDLCPTSANAAGYARAVAEAYRTRRRLDLADRYREAVNTGEGDLAAIVQEMLDLQGDQVIAHPPADVARMLREPAPPTRYIFDPAIPAGALCGVDAQGGLGKSWLVLMNCVSLACGRPLLGVFTPTEPRCVIYLSSEDPEEEIWRRLKRIVRAYGLGGEDTRLLEQNLVLYPGTRLPLAGTDVRGVVVPTAEYRHLQRLVERHQPGMLVLDPVAHFLGGTEENDNVQRAAFMNFLADLTGLVPRGMAVFLSGHVSKQREDTLDSAAGRGATAHRDAMRSLFGMTPLTENEAAKLGVTNPTLFVKLANTKANWAPRAGGVVHLQRDTGPETGGVLRQVDLNAQAEEIAGIVADRLAARVAELIADNPGDITVSEWCRGKDCADFRAVLKDQFGKHATQDLVKAGFERAERQGLLTLEMVKSGGPAKRVPRQYCGTATEPHEHGVAILKSNDINDLRGIGSIATQYSASGSL